MRAVSAACNSTRLSTAWFTSCLSEREMAREKAKAPRASARRPSPLRMESAENQSMGFRCGSFVTRLHVGPVDHIPERLHVVRLDVLVLQIEGVLPHVDLQQR